MCHNCGRDVLKATAFLMIFLLGLPAFPQTQSQTQATEVSGVFYLQTTSLVNAVKTPMVSGMPCL
jgi:hypothetical protein